MERSILTSLDSHWDELLREGQALNFRKGQILFYEGHTPYGLFVIREGKVGFSPGENRCEGEHLLPIVHGNVVGLHPFFSDTPYCCTCTAEEDCRVLFISKTQLLPFKETKGYP